MDNLTQHFQKIIEQDHILTPKSPFLVAVSGGLDSTCLLALIKNLTLVNPDQVWVVYVDHAQRQESRSESSSISQLAQNYGFHFEIGQIAGNPGTSETKLRTQRYRILEEIAKKHEISLILTAHHLDDLAETFLMQILRTGSIWGVNGIEKISRRNHFQFYRPLLAFSKADLLNYALQHHLSFHEDETNFSDMTLRNRIRHHFFQNPVFADQDWDHFLAFCTGFETLRQDTAVYYQRLIKEYSVQASNSAKVLNLQVLTQNPHLALTNFLSYFLINAGMSEVNQRMVNECCALLKNRHKPQGSIALDSQHVFFKTYNNFGFRSSIKESIIKPPFFYLNHWYHFNRESFGIFELSESNNENYQQKIPVQLSQLTLPLKWRHRLPGDYWFSTSGKKQKLGRFLIKHQIPNEQREQLLVLASGNQILYLENFGYTGLFKSAKTDKITSVVLIN